MISTAFNRATGPCESTCLVAVALLALLLPACSSNQVGETRSHIYNADTLDFEVFSPQERRKMPCAEDDQVIYLIIGEEAVLIEGPSLSSLGEEQLEPLFQFQAPSVEVLNDGISDVGLAVRINDRLSYHFSIDDFEGEGTVIGTASLSLVDGELLSTFVFAANGTSGVAHNVTVTLVLDGTPTGDPTAPLTIETRPDDDCLPPP